MLQSSQPQAPITADPAWRIGIVHSSFYKEEMETLVGGARQALLAAGIPTANIIDYPVPGSFEVPLMGEALAQAKKVDALIGLGIIVEGETHHARLLAEESVRGIMDVQLRHAIPFAFEILYVDKLVLAQQRLDKGVEAAVAVVQMLQVLRGL